MEKIVDYLLHHKKLVLILFTIIALNFWLGFDARFTIINLVWIFINLDFTKPEKD